tara:strand:+ start:17188 stop:17355 length:168 start_codon:yes stop_codon:yes gene_type:complete
MKDLYLTILVLLSIALNILAFMIFAKLLNNFINPYILISSGFILFLIVLLKYFLK